MNKLNFIEKLLKNQDPNKEVEKLLQKLPSNMEETAKQYGAMIRRRKIDSAVSLFLAIAMYVVMELSQRNLAAIFASTIDISDQAWQKKLFVAKNGYSTFCPKLYSNSHKKIESLLEKGLSS